MQQAECEVTSHGFSTMTMHLHTRQFLYHLAVVPALVNAPANKVISISFVYHIVGKSVLLKCSITKLELELKLILISFVYHFAAVSCFAIILSIAT